MAIPVWKTNINYLIGTIVEYNSLDYTCINAHKSQVDWFPCAATASLWKKIDLSAPAVPSVPVVPIVVPAVTPVQPIVTPVNKTSGIIIAPYLYTWGIGNSSYAINSCMDVFNKIKGNAVTLAFVIAGSGNQIAQDIYTFTDDIKAFIAVGGCPIISFGGADGTYIEQQLSITDIVLQISQLIEVTGCYHLDFDIEGNNLTNSSLNDTRSKAIAQLQAKYFGLYISFTLPADTNGLTAAGIACIHNAITNGVHLNCINIMTMDLGSLPSGQSWGDTACAIAETTLMQLKSLYPNKNQVDLYRLLGICPMIGKNDDGTIFTPNDAKIVSNYAKTHNIGLVSYWAINRDQVGTGDLGVYSMHNNVNFEYYNNFKSALPDPGTIVLPVVTPIIIPIPVVPVVNISPKWTTETHYTVGDKVSHGTSNFIYVNNHVSNLTLQPDTTPAIWKKL